MQASQDLMEDIVLRSRVIAREAMTAGVAGLICLGLILSYHGSPNKGPVVREIFIRIKPTLGSIYLAPVSRPVSTQTRCTLLNLQLIICPNA